MRLTWASAPDEQPDPHRFLRGLEPLCDAVIGRKPFARATHDRGFAATLLAGLRVTSRLMGVRAVDGEPKETKDISTLQRRFTSLRLLRLQRRLVDLAQRQHERGRRQAVHQIERERQRLGRQLHTGIGQLLAAIHLQLEVIAAELPSPPVKVGRALKGISTLAADALAQVRDVSTRLHPPEWQKLTLESAIRQLWEISGVPQRFDASLEIQPYPLEPSLEAKILIYRGLQEALVNMARHSRATRVTVALEVSDGQLVLSVCDNGVGFDAPRVFSKPASLASGIGLRSIRETAQELGGKLEVKSGADGTKLVVTVAPFPAES
jgi:signal transduction histidine kinase